MSYHLGTVDLTMTATFPNRYDCPGNCVPRGRFFGAAARVRLSSWATNPKLQVVNLEAVNSALVGFSGA